MTVFQVNGRRLIKGKPTYFIADIAANHDGDLQRAKDLIYLSKEAGADCAKFQHFEAKSIVSDYGFRRLENITTHQSSWEKPVSEIYDQYHTKREWDQELINTCKSADIDFMTTPYNLEAIDYFKEHMPAFKIGSGDITNLPLLEAVERTGMPVFLATGAATIEEVSEAMALFENSAVCLMQCNTNYTGSLENFRFVNLNVLKSFETKFPKIVLGFSDHTPGHSAVLGAVALGAVAIEKHFTDDNARVGPDHSFALNKKSWREMVDRTRELELSLGDGVKRIEENEKNTIIVQRRSIRAKSELKKGKKLEGSDFEFLRPCETDSITPMNYKDIIGRTLNKDIKRGSSIKWIDLGD